MATSFDTIRNAPRSDWPVRGSVTQSCGCTTDDSEPVQYASYDCFAFGGYGPTVVYAEYCVRCALNLKVSGLYLADEEAENRWMAEA